jgi:hypothetical protein
MLKEQPDSLRWAMHLTLNTTGNMAIPVASVRSLLTAKGNNWSSLKGILLGEFAARFRHLS